MKTSKGRVLLFISVITFISGLTYILKAQSHQMDINMKLQPPKTYSVTLTLDQWQGLINGMEGVKNKLKLSSLPSNEVTLINDSLLNLIQGEFVRQIQGQLAAEQKPKDTTNKAKKN